MMNPKIKKLWIEALKSGEYGQGSGMLRPDKTRFCCLGVLCDLHQKSGFGYEWERDESNSINPYHYDDHISYLPPCVVTWAGLENDNPFVSVGDDRITVGNMNDSGASFEEIAAVVERYL
jgi:hypothetical protein